MKRKDKADKIRQILDEHYPQVEIPLDHRDPYTLLVAVVLSAQCTDKRVNEIAPLLFEKAATPAQMAELTLDEIEAIIRPCGLSNSKAKAIAGFSRTLLSTHEGKVPDDLDSLEALPGVGHKTASVVLVQAFNKPAFPVDTHIHRCAARWGLSSGKNVAQTEKDLKPLFKKAAWGRIHLQIIYFGREHCKARYHDFENCAICSWATTEKQREDERARDQRKKKK